VHCDATYQTAKGRFELYGIVGSIKGAGFPIAYLILSTKASNNEEQMEPRTKALAGFFRSLCDKGLRPQYFYTDKDFAEINAAKEVWPNADIQLCQWHLERAIRQKLKSRKRIYRN
jgi:transposase-like protein